MAQITVSDHLYIAHAHDQWPSLMALSTFRRKGRLRAKQRRVIHYYGRLKDGRLILPRGLLTRVRKILPAAAVLDARFTVRPVEFGFRWELRDYQQAVVQAVLRQSEGVVVAPPASGKTVIGLALAAAWRQPTLFLVHTLRLVDQTKDKARHVLTLPRGGLGVVADSAKQYGSHLTIATIQTLAKKPRYVRELAQRVGTVIVDECFVAGTLVDGRPIEDLKTGDAVWAFDPDTNASCLVHVTATQKHPAKEIIAVAVSGDTLKCTPNHLFWTTEGWATAGHLTPRSRVWSRDGWVAVTDVWRIYSSNPVWVYNISVEPPYTYMVGTARIGVHNCHHLPSESFQKVVNSFPAKFRAGLSATPGRADGLGLVITAVLGPRVVIPRKILRNRAVIMDPTIYLVETAWVPPEEVSFAISERRRSEDPLRNALVARIVWMARHKKQRVLVLVELERHAFILADILTRSNIPAYPVVGRLSTAIQDQRFRAMEEGKAVVVATKLANEGLDWPALDCLVMATPGRSATVLEQRTGRIARTSPGKSLAAVYDLVDSHSEVYAHQYLARLETYREMGYRVRRWTIPNAQ